MRARSALSRAKDAGLIRVVLAVGLIFACLATCRAQEVSATLYGTVTDPAGASIPDASVTVTDPAKGHSVTTKTRPDGSYIVTSLPAATYTLVVEHPGFEKSVQTGIKLDVSQKGLVNVQLRVGALTTSVEVASSAPLVETATATVGATITGTQVSELPLNIRRFGTLPLLMPGTVPDRGGFSSNIFGSPFSEDTYATNGLRGSGNNILIDGVDSKNMFTGGFSIQPSPDAIQEFKIQTQSFSAVFGKNGGSTINLVTKSGTNEIHGTGFEFLRNDKLDARNFFDNERPAFQRNQFGGYMGGPIKKNKTFWFGGYEALRRRKGLTSAGQVPTPAMLRGDFSELLPEKDPTTNKPPYLIYDPTGPNCKPVPPFSGCEAFPGNIIPDDRIDPVARKVGAYFPAPNRPGSPNFVVNPKERRTDNQFSGRVDHTFGPKDNIYARYMFAQSVTFTTDQAYTTLPGFGDKIRYRGQNIAFSWTHTLSPTILNEFRFGFSRNMDIGTCENCPRAKGFVESFGIANLKALSPEDEGFPYFGLSQGYFGIGDSNYRPVESNDMIEKYNDTLTITKGKHTIATGVDMQPYQSLRDQAPFSPHGQFDFSNLYSNFTVSDFLLGYPGSAGRSVAKRVNYHDGKFLNAFFQDDFRATPNLTINIGVRWEYHQLPTDRRDTGAALFPIPGMPLQTPGNAFLVVPGYAQADQLCHDPRFILDQGLSTERHLVMCAADMKKYGFTGRAARSLWFPDRFNWAPRLGIVWRPTSSDRLVMRAGYGLFFELSQFNGFHYGFNNPVQAPNQFVNFESGVTPPARIDTAFLVGEIPPLSDSFLSINVTPYFRQPYVHEWTFNVESQMTNNMAVEVRYLGTAGRQMSHFHFFGNQAIPGLGDIQPRRLYPDLGFTAEVGSGTNTSYNSLQLQLTRKMSNGLSILAGYTWAKSITDQEAEEGGYADGGAGLGQNDNDPKGDRGRGVDDARHRFTVGYIYELPLGRGKRWADQGGVVDAILGGWKVTGNTSFQTGFPITPSTSFDVANVGTGSWRPDRTCNGSLPPSQRTVEHWFNPSCFTIGTAYNGPLDDGPDDPGSGLLRELTVYDVGPNGEKIFTGHPRFGNSGRSILDGPGFQNWDFALLKDFSFGERLKMQFRAEFFNAFNQAHFSDPVRDITDPTAGQIFNAGEPRNIQFGLKFLF
jgi:hypothetical protein